MHELSVALRIVEALDQELAGETASSINNLDVSTVTIQVGALTGVVPEALLFSWDFATVNSSLKGSNLDIQVIDAVGYCTSCQAEQPLTNLASMRCPVCHTSIKQITGGNELEILTVEVGPANKGFDNDA